MTRIAYASDLHLEFYHQEATLLLDGLADVDVLVLAGDVETMPEYYTEVLRRLRTAYTGPVIFVLGNHEYYGGLFPDAQQQYREAIAHDRQAFLLEKESVILCGVRFLGTTLWTDFAKGKQQRNCQHMMSDFEVIEDGLAAAQGICQPITTKRILAEHQESLAWLEEQIRVPCTEPTVVVTHHAPSFLSQHPRFAGSPISGGYCSNLEPYLQRWNQSGVAPACWIHGHLHDSANYQIGKTRILCYPWGYPEENRVRTYRFLEIEGNK